MSRDRMQREHRKLLHHWRRGWLLT